MPTVLITGGGRGIGAATALHAARAGYDVAITYVSEPDAARQVVADAEALGARALAIQADAASEADVVRTFRAVDETFGPLDALVANAGITGRFSRVDEVDAALLERVLAVNVTGAFLCCREAVRRMSTAHGGRGGAIVTVSSRAAVLGSPGEYVHYAASKAAVDTLTRGLAKEVGPEDIRVNAVAPGPIQTDIHARNGRPERLAAMAGTIPLRRPGTSDEVAAGILWLLSPQAAYVTGAILDIGGGR